MKYFDTFTGIGGFTLGIQRGINNSECVGYSEIDKYANAIYSYHFPLHKNYGDITKIDPNTIQDFNLLVGGFPCQSFSIAGQRRGFHDTRGTLFFDLARILQVKRPETFIFENVKGLLSHEGGRTFRTIISTLDELGYNLQWQVLNSKNFGVPQNRERIYIVGHLRGTGRREIFPIREDKIWFPKEEGNIQREIQTQNWKRDSLHINRKILQNGSDRQLHCIGGIVSVNKQKEGIEIKQHPQGNRVYSISGISSTLASLAGGLGAKTGLYEVDVSKEGTSISKESRIRKLTPKECERLQAFPDDWTKYGVDEHGKTMLISDTQRYKCCGNAITVNVVQHIIEQLYR